MMYLWTDSGALNSGVSLSAILAAVSPKRSGRDCVITLQGLISNGPPMISGNYKSYRKISMGDLKKYFSGI